LCALACVACLTGGSAIPALATTRTVDLNSFQQQDLRALAMGNAFDAAARGETALQYNPAGLAQYDFDLKADYSVTAMAETGNFLTDTEKVNNSGASNQDVQNYLMKYDGTSHIYALQTFPSLVANLGFANFGFGAGKLDVQRYGITFNEPTGVYNPPTDSITVDEDRAVIGLGGVGLKLFSGKAFLGVTAKTVQYTESTATLLYSALVNNSQIKFNLIDTVYNQATAYDWGFIYRVEWLPLLKPQWSITGYNIGGYKLTGTPPGGTTSTVLVPETYNVGASIQPDFGFVHILATADVEDVGGAIKVQDSNGVYRSRSNDQLVHAGLEVGLFKTPTGNNWFSVRGGSNGGFLTYGAEINLGGFLRAVYTHGNENLIHLGQPQFFKFDAYQLALGFAW
jgi:hypothetical protein